MEYKIFNPDFKARVLEHLERQNFMHLIGFELTSIEAGEVEGWLDMEGKHQQQNGFTHGGVTATVADIVAGFSAYTLVPQGHRVVTGELKISYLNVGKGSKIFARGWVLKQGKKMSFCEAEVWSVEGEQRTLIAKASTTMVTIFPEDLQKK